MLPSDANSPQDRSAQTRIKNDQQRASQMQIASRAVRQSLQKPDSKTFASRQTNVPHTATPAPAAAPRYMQQPVAKPHINGPQPIGELGEFLKAMAKQESGGLMMEQGAGPLQTGNSSIDIEEFLQSPALQEAVARTKLTQYFSAGSDNAVGINDSPTYANSVLANMARYR